MEQQKNNSPSELQENRDLIMYFNIIKSHIWVLIATILFSVTLVSIASFKAQPIYRATVKLLIEKQQSGAQDYTDSMAFNLTGSDYYLTQYKMLKTRVLCRFVMSELDLAKYDEFQTKHDPIKTSLLFIYEKLKSGSLGRSIIHWLDLEKNEMFLSKDDPVEIFMDHIIVEPIKGSRLVNLHAESVSPELAARVANSLANAYLRMNMELSLSSSQQILQKLIKNISMNNAAEKRSIEALPVIVKNPLIQSLKEELIKAEANYANLSKRYKKKHPTMITLNAQINLLRKNIISEMRNAVESFKTEFDGTYKSNNVSIVDSAEVPLKPERPKILLNIFFAFFGGLILGLLLIFGAEYFNDTIKNELDVEQFLGIPFLGGIPRRKKHSDKFLTSKDPKDPFTEVIKITRMNINFSTMGADIKTLLFTSCLLKEGKTFMAMNIAASFAEAGNKTLIIDTDCHRGKLTKMSKMLENKGFIDYLFRGAPLDEIIHKTEINNLSFIPRGSKPHSHEDLFASPKISELINDLRGRYDKIIFDSSSVLSVADTLAYSHMVDGVVMVMLFGKTDRTIAHAALHKLKDVGSKVIGGIINNIDKRAFGSYYGYY